MPTFRTKRRVPYTPMQMFDIIADVDAYPEFLPMCEGLVVRSRDKVGDSEVLVARMTVGYKAIRESFTTKVTLDDATPAVLVQYLDGPFEYLENRWGFKPLETGGCEIDFFLDYEFRSRMLSLVMGAVFDRAFQKFAEAFEDRARQVYGARGGVTSS